MNECTTFMYVCSRVLSDSNSHHLKTQIVSNQVNPVWNELQVMTSFDALNKDEFIEFSVWDCTNPSDLSFMGGVILGSTSSPPNRNACIDREVKNVNFAKKKFFKLILVHSYARH